MQISLEVPPQKEITGVEVGGSGRPVVTSEGIATHYSSVKLAIQQAEIISCDVAASVLERVFFFGIIYPSQRQNLLPTLEISNQNFQNFHNFQNFGKKFQNLEFFSKISKTTKGPPPTHYPITKFLFFFKSFQSSGYIT